MGSRLELSIVERGISKNNKQFYNAPGRIYIEAEVKEHLGNRYNLSTSLGEILINGEFFHIGELLLLELHDITPPLIENSAINSLTKLITLLDKLDNRNISSETNAYDIIQFPNSLKEQEINNFITKIAEFIGMTFNLSALTNKEDLLADNIYSETKLLSAFILNETSSLPWLHIPIPYKNSDDTLHFINIFIKNSSDENKRIGRFVIEVEVHGKKVIDGFFNFTNGKTLSCNLKSENILPQSDIDHIKAVFTNAASNYDVNASINFSTINKYQTPLAENLKAYCLNRVAALEI
jgi:hypothetical protein